MSQSTKAELLLVVSSFIWGSTFVVVKAGLADASPFAFIAVRFALAGLLMYALVAHGKLPLRAVRPSVLLGVILFAGFAFQTWGLVFTTPSKSAFITGFSVILVPPISMMSGYSLRAANAGGALLGLLGIYCLVVPAGIASVNRGDLLTLAGAVAFSIHITLVATYTRRVSFMHLAPGQILVVAIAATVATWLSPASAMHWTGRLVFAIAVTAIFATAFAFSAQIWAQGHTPPAHAALIFALEPLFAALTSRIVIKEHLGGKALLGSALILAGMVVSEIWGRTPPSPIEG